MTFTTQYIICNMYFLSECFRSESDSESLRWNIRRIFLQKIVQGCIPPTIFVKKSVSDDPSEFEYHSADSKPLLTFSKCQVADLFAN